MKKITRKILLAILLITLTVTITALSACKNNETYTVVFNSNGGSEVAPITDVPRNSRIDEPTAPTRFGYTFDGWYSDARLTNKWNFDRSKVQGNITLYAKWTYAPTESLLYKSINDSAYAVAGLGSVTSKQIVIPERHEGLPVIRIDDRAFQNTKITDVYIPGTITSVGINAFDRCSELKTAVVSSSITAIPDYMFNECVKLESIIIPAGVTTIGVRAFYDCKSLSNVTIPSNVTEICENAFSGCVKFTSVNIPARVTKIGAYAFSGCVAIEELKVAQGNSNYRSEGNCIIEYNSLGNTVVVGCKESVIPSTVTAIGDGAFKGCKLLTSISIPLGITKIGESAFDGCMALTIVNLPGSVKEIGAYAFSNCDYLETVEFRGDIDASELESIGKEAFSHCFSMLSFVIPQNVNSIGVGAFYDCGGGDAQISYRGTRQEFENVEIIKDDGDPTAYSSLMMWFAAENTFDWIPLLGGTRN